MAIVKSARKISALLGKVFDEEDRELLGQALGLLVYGAVLVLGAAFVLGLAVRLFSIASG